MEKQKLNILKMHIRLACCSKQLKKIEKLFSIDILGVSGEIGNQKNGRMEKWNDGIKETWKNKTWKFGREVLLLLKSRHIILPIFQFSNTNKLKTLTL